MKFLAFLLTGTMAAGFMNPLHEEQRTQVKMLQQESNYRQYYHDENCYQADCPYGHEYHHDENCYQANCPYDHEDYDELNGRHYNYSNRQGGNGGHHGNHYHHNN